MASKNTEADHQAQASKNRETFKQEKDSKPREATTRRCFPPSLSQHQLSTLAYKFLLRLLEAPEHALPLSEIHPNPQTSLTQCRSVARQLQSLSLVDYDETILEIAITPKGRLMLEIGMAARPVTPDELLVLKSCQHNRITIGQISRKVPEAMQRSLIDALESRQLVKTKRQIEAVALTPTGLAFLEQSKL